MRWLWTSDRVVSVFVVLLIFKRGLVAKDCVIIIKINVFPNRVGFYSGVNFVSFNYIHGQTSAGTRGQRL